MNQTKNNFVFKEMQKQDNSNVEAIVEVHVHIS